MARFSQQFLAGLTRPSYGRGLFEAAQGIGQTFAERSQDRDRQNMLQQFMQGSPVQQGRILQEEGVRTGNLALITQGQQIEKTAIDDSVQKGIDAIKARMLKLPEDQLDVAQQNLENYVKSVGGNVLDVANVATEIRKQRQQQELNQYQFEEKRERKMSKRL